MGKQGKRKFAVIDGGVGINHKLLLASLRRAECLSRALDRADGPRRPKSSLSDGSSGQPHVADETCEVVGDHLAAIWAIEDVATQKLILKLIETEGPHCTPVHTVRSAAAALDIPRSTAFDRFAKGMELVSANLAAIESLRMAA